MDYRDELVRQRIKQMVEQGGYFQPYKSKVPIYMALITVGLVVGGLLGCIAHLP